VAESPLDYGIAIYAQADQALQARHTIAQPFTTG